LTDLLGIAKHLAVDSAPGISRIGSKAASLFLALGEFAAVELVGPGSVAHEPVALEVAVPGPAAP
jgi:hypothetical protein